MKKMGYSNELDKVLRHALSELIENYQSGISMFDANKNINYGKMYQILKN